MTPERTMQLIDELEQALGSLETQKALQKIGVSPELGPLCLRGLKDLLEGRVEAALQVFETLSEELNERTVALY